MKWARIGAVAALVVSLLILDRITGLSDTLSRDALRAQVAAAGGWGVPLFLGAFCIALLLHVPATGILFVGVGVALYGRLPGAALAYAGSVIGVVVSFAIVRGIGGRPLAEVKNRLFRRVLEKLEARPITTVIVLRLLFFAGAPVNYALALAGVRFRDYLIGSVIGMAPPVIVLALFFDLLIG